MKDGVLTITYSFEPEADRPLVSAMDYDDSFTFAPYGKDDDYRMNVRIDPNDLPAPSSADVEVKETKFVRTPRPKNEREINQ